MIQETQATHLSNAHYAISAMDCDEIPIPRNEEWALFLDIDGTISDIADSPDKAFIPHDILSALAGLKTRAVALISGRDIPSIERLAAPYRFTMAGQHGLELSHEFTPSDTATTLPRDLITAVERITRLYAGLYAEFKSRSIAVHYRNAPHMESRVLAHLHPLAKHYPDICIQPGKMVFELRPRGADKGDAIIRFMERDPFAGKRPVFIGDDITDEAGFRVVNALNGISIKVGSGETAAAHRLESPSQARRWLAEMIPLLNSSTSLALQTQKTERKTT